MDNVYFKINGTTITLDAINGSLTVEYNDQSARVVTYLDGTHYKPLIDALTKQSVLCEHDGELGPA